MQLLCSGQFLILLDPTTCSCPLRLCSFLSLLVTGSETKMWNSGSQHLRCPPRHTHTNGQTSASPGVFHTTAGHASDLGHCQTLGLALLGQLYSAQSKAHDGSLSHTLQGAPSLQKGEPQSTDCRSVTAQGRQKQQLAWPRFPF